MATPDPDRWHELSPYLDQWFDIDGEEARAAWLASLRSENPTIASRLDVLIEGHLALSRDAFLERGPGLPLSQAAQPGQAIGPYTLVSPIGAGGMGSVWLAERGDGRFERRVAVKFLSIALAGRGEERFTREGRMLARLTHPHIAQLVDAGVSAAGQPYLVLEHVEGEDIDRYCEHRGLSIAARLALFLEVATAVEHAHAHLIVHRDLKPSNVLVGADGHAKLLDFGIAKILEESDEGGVPTTLTRDAGVALTPEYAAPEQITGEPVTAATDVYALGMLLYVLLTGQHPAAAADRSPADMVRAIVETQTPRMSDAVGRTDKRYRVLHGDLDTIVGKALKKSPSERYASVTALADDIRRYLRHEPIGARPDSVTYRAVKFVRRNRLLVAASVLLLAGLSIGLYAVNRERAIAQRRFLQVRELAGKLFDIDVQVRQLPGGTKTRQLIVDTALDYLSRLAAEVGGDKALALEVGTAYMRVARVQGVPISPSLGQGDQAEANLRIAESYIDSVLASDPANRTALLRSAQIAHDRMILAGMRRPSVGALALAHKSAAQLEKYLAGGPLTQVAPLDAQQVVIAYMNVANRYIVEGDPDEGIRMCRRTIEIARATNQPAQVGAALLVVLQALRAKGDLEGALLAAREAVAILEPPPGDTGVGRAFIFSLALTRAGAVLGDIQGVSLGRPDEAIPLLERAVNINEELARKDPDDANVRSRLATAGIYLGGIVRDSDPRRALEVYDLTLRRLAEIKNNPKARRDEATALSESTYALRRLGRIAEARERLDAAFARLSTLKMYPAREVELGSEPVTALQARADHEAGTGRVQTAIETYQSLLDAVMASKPEPEKVLSDAAELSRLYESLSALHRLSASPARASDLDARRLALWRHWHQKLPTNAFVASQLASVTK